MIKDGKIVRNVMRSFKLDEISGVDRPAQVHAKAVIMKRDVPLEKIIASMALTTMTGGHAHLITMGGGDYLRRAGQTDYVDGHSHPWLMTEAGDLVVGHAMGHNHGIEILAKGETTPDALKRLMSKDGKPAPAGDDQPAGKIADNNGKTKDQNMTPEEKLAAETAAVAKKHSDEVATLTKRAERAEKVAVLSDQHRSQFRVLKGADADAFIEAPDTERDESIRKAQEANQVVFTAMDGTTYRKSDDARLVTMAKTVDEEKKKRKEMEDKAKKAELEKRAEGLAHVPGTLEERVALLKGIDTLPEDDRAKALTALKAQNERLGKSFQRIGTTEAPDTDDNLDPLDKMAAEIAKRDKVSFEQAYTKALNTPEGQKLYNKHVAAREAVRG